MLKATIIYLPGSAGNMLYKTLTLSEKTITGTSGRDLNEYEKKLTAEEKFNQYSSWDSQNWKKEELKYCLNFKLGLADFYHYEQCKLWLIDHWHPVEFYNQYITNILWGDTFYEKVILIQVTPDHKEFLISNQNTKQYSLNFDDEYQHQLKLQNMFQDRILTISFDSFFNEDTYLDQIVQLDKKLNLELDIALVARLWQNWFRESSLVWKNNFLTQSRSI
jgi:hypothetical protein